LENIIQDVIFLVHVNHCMGTWNTFFGNHLPGKQEEKVYIPDTGYFKNTLFDPYRIVRIGHEQRCLVAGLFNDYRIYYNLPSNHSLANRFIGDRLLNDESVIFTALTNEPDSFPVGFVQLYPKYSSLQATQSMILNDLFVLPVFRNRGLALKLIEVAIKFAVANHSAEIQLETLHDNLAAQKLYESVGFKKRAQPADFYTYFIKLEKD